MAWGGLFAAVLWGTTLSGCPSDPSRRRYPIVLEASGPPPREIAEAELARWLAHASPPHLPPGTDLVVGCCLYFAAAGTPVIASLAVRLPDLDDPLSVDPILVPLRQAWRISNAGEILEGPNFAEARAMAPERARSGMRALGIAHAHFVDMATYEMWRTGGRTYRTGVIPGDDAYTITFQMVLEGTEDRDHTKEPSSVVLEVVRGAVVGGHLGPHHTPL